MTQTPPKKVPTTVTCLLIETELLCQSLRELYLSTLDGLCSLVLDHSAIQIVMGPNSDEKREGIFNQQENTIFKMFTNESGIFYEL